MTTRAELLCSCVRLLPRDQTAVTTTFNQWNGKEGIQQHNSVGAVVAATCRRLKRDQDRLLRQCYRNETESTSDRSKLIEKGLAETKETSERAVLPPDPSLVELLQKGSGALDGLRTRHASVYSLATAIMQPPVANVARSGTKSTRELMGALIVLLPIVTTESVTTTHPDVVVNLEAGPRAQEVLRGLWSPGDQREEATEATHFITNHTMSTLPPFRG